MYLQSTEFLFTLTFLFPGTAHGVIHGGTEILLRHTYAQEKDADQAESERVPVLTSAVKHDPNAPRVR